MITARPYVLVSHHLVHVGLVYDTVMLHQPCFDAIDGPMRVLPPLCCMDFWSLLLPLCRAVGLLMGESEAMSRDRRRGRLAAPVPAGSASTPLASSEHPSHFKLVSMP